MPIWIFDPVMTGDPPDLLHELGKRAGELGLTPPRITRVDAPWSAGDRLHSFIKAGFAGDMDWLSRQAHRRQHPNDLWAEARSAVLVGLNYGPDHNPMCSLNKQSHGNISVYARGMDYHDLFKKRLKKIAGWLHQQTGKQVKVFVDTAPLMEKPLAARSGLGWQGKHTNLVSREFGSWLFLGVILTEAKLNPTPASGDHCGSCRACLDVCPTQAFIAPRQLDARACISYLTIEHKGHIPAKYRKAMGNRIYGCDDCLAVCPWNKYAVTAREAKLHARPEAKLPLLGDLATLSDADFRAVYAGSPIKRTGRTRMVRNVLIAIGNSKDPGLIPSARTALQDASPLVRAMAVWALAQLLLPVDFIALQHQHMANETDPDVAKEWTRDQG